MKTTSSKLFIMLGIFAMFAMTSCEGFAPTIKVPFESKTEFNLAPQTAKIANADKATVLLHEWSFNQDLNTLIEEYGGNAEKIKESNIKTVTLTLKSKDGIDLSSIFNTLQLKVDNIPAVEEELVAESDAITENSITFNLVKGDIFNYTSGENGFKFLLYGDVNWDYVVTVMDFEILVESELVVELL
jgi:hypothetical protein